MNEAGGGHIFEMEGRHRCVSDAVNLDTDVALWLIPPLGDSFVHSKILGLVGLRARADTALAPWTKATRTPPRPRSSERRRDREEARTRTELGDRGDGQWDRDEGGGGGLPARQGHGTENGVSPSSNERNTFLKHRKDPIPNFREENDPRLYTQGRIRGGDFGSRNFKIP